MLLLQNGGKGGVRLYEKYICMERMPQASRDHIRRIGTSHGYCWVTQSSRRATHWQVSELRAFEDIEWNFLFLISLSLTHAVSFPQVFLWPSAWTHAQKIWKTLWCIPSRILVCLEIRQVLYRSRNQSVPNTVKRFYAWGKIKQKYERKKKKMFRECFLLIPKIQGG